MRHARTALLPPALHGDLGRAQAGSDEASEQETHHSIARPSMIQVSFCAILPDSIRSSFEALAEAHLETPYQVETRTSIVLLLTQI
jgi:hypothetical protein